MILEHERKGIKTPAPTCDATKFVPHANAPRRKGHALRFFAPLREIIGA
jgi:hypothetical protein